MFRAFLSQMCLQTLQRERTRKVFHDTFVCTSQCYSQWVFTMAKCTEVLEKSCVTGQIPWPSLIFHFTHSPWDSDGDSSLDLWLLLWALTDFISRPHANIATPSWSTPTGATLIYHVHKLNFYFKVVPSTCTLLIHSNFCFFYCSFLFPSECIFVFLFILLLSYFVVVLFTLFCAFFLCYA